eukprot:5291006-Prymnesium_polylepis.2
MHSSKSARSSSRVVAARRGGWRVYVVAPFELLVGALESDVAVAPQRVVARRVGEDGRAALLHRVARPLVEPHRLAQVARLAADAPHLLGLAERIEIDAEQPHLLHLEHILGADEDRVDEALVVEDAREVGRRLDQPPNHLVEDDHLLHEHHLLARQQRRDAGRERLHVLRRVGTRVVLGDRRELDGQVGARILVRVAERVVLVCRLGLLGRPFDRRPVLLALLRLDRADRRNRVGTGAGRDLWHWPHGCRAAGGRRGPWRGASRTAGTQKRNRFDVCGAWQADWRHMTHALCLGDTCLAVYARCDTKQKKKKKTKQHNGRKRLIVLVLHEPVRIWPGL